MEAAIQVQIGKATLNDNGEARHRQCVLLDWGDTVMRVFAEYSGPMEKWPKVELVPGVAEAIRQVRSDALVCLATNAADSNERAINAALARVGLNRLFDRIFCFETVGNRKPSEAYYQKVLCELGLPPEKVFMVGDDFYVDVLGAADVGIRSLWLNRSTGEDRSGGMYGTIHSFEELIASLEGLGFLRS